MEPITKNIRKLVSYGRQTGLVPEEDVVYTFNRLLELFGLDEPQDCGAGEAGCETRDSMAGNAGDSAANEERYSSDTNVI